MLIRTQLDAIADNLKGIINFTPLLQSLDLNELTGCRALLKLENLQRMGAFKIRGAYTRLSQLTPAQQATGVVAYSSGNHAQGVALAAKLLGIKATIVMPQDAPSVKIARTRALGAAIHLYDRQTESREDIAQRLAQASGAVIVPPYDDPAIIAGQATVAYEIVQQAQVMGVEKLDHLLVCCGGGGLSAGAVVTLSLLSPETHLWTVEPEHYNDMALSLEKGERVTIAPTETSACDALLHHTPGALTFDLLKRYGAKGLTVTEQQVRQAMSYAMDSLRIVLEPGGAVALAALLSQPGRFAGQTVGVICSGGNIQPALIAELLM